MGIFKRYSKKALAALTLAVCLTMVPVQAAAAEEITTSGGWVDENLGPGVAKWVDESGRQISAYEKMKTEDTTDMQGPGVLKESQPAGETMGDQNTVTDEQSGQPAAEGESQPESEGESQPAVETPVQESQPQKEPVQEQPQKESQPAGRVIDPSRPMIALTFDDGPYARVGNKIMDSLAQYGGKATFFVVGSRASTYKTELIRMAAEGHEIGNHTYDHKYLTSLSPAQIRAQVTDCANIVQSVCGVRPSLVRLPGGLKNSTVLANIDAPIIMWSIDTRDWKTRNAQASVDAVIGKVRDGDVVLMHELYEQSGQAALTIIPKLIEQGYQLVTVSELATYRGGLAKGTIYSSFRQ